MNDEIQAPCGGKVPGAKSPNDETIERMWRFAERIAPAKFLPPELRNDPASLFYAIATGEDLGLKWTHATRSFFPSRDGGLGTKGDIMLSLLLVKKFDVNFTFTDAPIGCTCEIYRPDADAEEIQMRYFWRTCSRTPARTLLFGGRGWPEPARVSATAHPVAPP